jgi:hypothetical protein
MMLGSRDTRRQMGEDEIVPAVKSDEPISGGQVNANLPFLP